MENRQRLLWLVMLIGAGFSAASAGAVIVGEGASIAGALSVAGLASAWIYCTRRSRDVWIEGHGSSVEDVLEYEAIGRPDPDLQLHCRDCGVELEDGDCTQSTPLGPVHFCLNCCPQCSIGPDTEPELDEQRPRPTEIDVTGR
jgi:hypothetical protein